MVRMLGIRSICLSRLCDNGFRLTHPADTGVEPGVNAQRRVRDDARKGETTGVSRRSRRARRWAP